MEIATITVATAPVLPTVLGRSKATVPEPIPSLQISDRNHRVRSQTPRKKAQTAARFRHHRRRHSGGHFDHVRTSVEPSRHLLDFYRPSFPRRSSELDERSLNPLDSPLCRSKDPTVGSSRFQDM
ncbi:hypothetical protein V6N13_130611 [Hibiscus sabdariffa]